MRKALLLLALVFSAVLFKVLAERINIPGLILPKLIISEVRNDEMGTAYIELTNLGTTTIDLAPFSIQSVNSNTKVVYYSDSTIQFQRLSSTPSNPTIGRIPLKGSIKPGESLVFANVYDANNARRSGIPLHNTAIALMGKQFAHLSETNNKNGWINKPEWQTFGKDSVSGENIRLFAGQSASYLLHWRYLKDNVNEGFDSTYIDLFNFNYNPILSTPNSWPSISPPIAGVENAVGTSVMVRKATVTKGNLKWDQSRGVDAQTSEWIVIPKNTSNNMAFTTVGSHGKYNLDYSAKNPTKVSIDNISAVKTISLPWGVVRGDSIVRLLNLGKNMGWSHRLNTVFADSASYIFRTGDKLSLYAAGDVLQKVDFTLNVREASADQAAVFPRRRLQSTLRLITNPNTGLKDSTYRITWSAGFEYALSEGIGMDSIINIGFATRTDSLFKYLDKPEKAKWEIVFVDGQNRPELKFGDKLKVTSENNAVTKEYFIAISEYVKSNNAILQTVIWPDIVKANYPHWTNGDTIPGFNTLKSLNEIELNIDEKKVPALQFITQDSKAKISVVNAINLTGTPDHRTTKVTVTSESDSVKMTYHFTFKKQGVPVQQYIAEPFFSEFIKATGTQGYAIEIVNPSTVDLDLSRYCIVRGAAGQTWQQAVATLPTPATAADWAHTEGIKIYQSHYFPSMRFKNDGSMEAWNDTPTPTNPYAGKGFLMSDGIYNPIVKPGDVWVGGTTRNAYNGITQQAKIFREADFLWKGFNDFEGKNRMNAWPNYTIFQQSTPAWTRNYQYLLKVINDSIMNGTKDVRDASAYELIDRFEVKNDIIYPQNVTTAINIGSATGITLVRKPHIIKGIQTIIGGTEETPASSEWMYYSNTANYIGQHYMNPVTNYKSTVTSLKLLVTPGYEGNDLSIKGSIATYTPTTIAAVLEKADSSQVFVFKRGATVLAAGESLADADILEVTSGNGENTTKYKLINVPLDNNTSLMAKAGSGLSVTNNKVSGVTVGMKLKDALDKLEVAEKSLLYVYNSTGGLQSLRMHDSDKLVFYVLVNENFKLEVVAENGDKKSYSFDFGVAGIEAIPLSSTLEIQFYPNPVSNVINFVGTEFTKVKIYSLTGILMISDGNLYGNKMNVSSLLSGIYLLEMTDKEGKIVVDKFLKK